MNKIIQYFTTRKTCLTIVLAWLAVDQLTKYLAVASFQGNPPLSVIDGLFNLRLAYNRGVSFSLLGEIPHDYLPAILGVFAIGMACIFMHWMGYAKEGRFFKIGLSFIAGGALGNGIDRFVYGAVVDFLDIYVQQYHWPTFNVADIAIFLGVSLILWSTYMHTSAEKEEIDHKDGA